MAYLNGKEVLFDAKAVTVVAPVVVDNALSDTSTNPVQNKVVKDALDDLTERVLEQGLDVADAVDGLEDRITTLENKPIDDHVSLLSENPVQNKVVTERLQSLTYRLDDVASAVLYTPQFPALTEEQKAQARENIGAGTGGLDEIEDGSITPEKTSFVEVEEVRLSPNLFDPSTMGTKGLFYSAHTPMEGTEPVKNTSENYASYFGINIPMDGLAQITISSAKGTFHNYFFLGADGKIISGKNLGYANIPDGITLEVPEGAVTLIGTLSSDIMANQYFMVVEGDKALPYEPYSGVTQKLHIPNLVIPEQDDGDEVVEIPDGSITPEKTNFAQFVPSENLFDKETMVTIGSWFENKNGKAQLIKNEWTGPYGALDIPVSGLNAVTFHCAYEYTNVYSWFATDADYKIIQGEPAVEAPMKAGYTITIPDNAVWLRVSISSYATAQSSSGVMVAAGTEAKPYTPYKNKVRIPDLDLETDKKELFVGLPEKYDLVVGDTFELFYKGIMLCKDPYQYNILVDCDMGNSYRRKYVVTPTAGKVGEHTLSITVRDDFGTILAHKSVTLNVVNKATSPTENINVLCVGDSLTEPGVWVDEAYRRLTKTTNKTQHDANAPSGDGLSNITFVGKKTTANGAGYEGIGGWIYDYYIDPTNPKNPFVYDGVVDFNAYCADLGIDHIDQCYILLGWNMAYYTESGFKSKAKAFIDLLIAHNPNIKIVLVGIQIPFLDGLSHGYPVTDDYYSNYRGLQEFVFNLDKWNKDLAAEYLDNITSINLSGQFDTEYGVWTREVAVNTRHTIKVEEQGNGLHPGNEGYYQIADAVYRKFTADNQGG